MKLSVIVPIYNEEENVENFLKELNSVLSNVNFNYEILLINDCSTDNTLEKINKSKVKAKIISHPYNKGNGAAVKTGIRNAKGEFVVMLDGDGQHNPKDILRIFEQLEQGYDLVVGARDKSSQASFFRYIANSIYNLIASYVSGFKVEDLTSGLRGAKRQIIKKFLYLFPNGFSYPTTSLLAFLKAGYSVKFIPIKTRKRKGNSKIRILKDGARFFAIIAKVTVLFSPLKVFLPVSVIIFIGAVTHFIYRYLMSGKYTLFTGILILASLFVFLMGLISEQIAMIQYSSIDEDEHKTP
jgi:glycosyltransferase involved in cell wall biosynthesis